MFFFPFFSTPDWQNPVKFSEIVKITSTHLSKRWFLDDIYPGGPVCDINESESYRASYLFSILFRLRNFFRVATPRTKERPRAQGPIFEHWGSK